MFLFTKEAVIGVVRTAMPYVWAWLLTLLASWEWLVNSSIGGLLFDWINRVDPLSFAVIAGTVIYGAIRQFAERWPWFGYLLVFNEKPRYPSVEAA